MALGSTHFPSKLWKRILHLDRWTNHILPCLSHWIQLRNSYRMNGVTAWGLWKVNRSRKMREEDQNERYHQTSSTFPTFSPVSSIQYHLSWQREIQVGPSDSESRIREGTQLSETVGKFLAFLLIFSAPRVSDSPLMSAMSLGVPDI